MRTGDLSDGIWSAADWPAPAWVHAGASLRRGGRSDDGTNAAWSGFNLAIAIDPGPAGPAGDDEAMRVLANRAALRQRLRLPAEPLWLRQVHGNTVIDHADYLASQRQGTQGMPPQADAMYAAAPGQVCAVLTADCVPLLLCDRRGKQVAAVHIGWRGLCQHIIDKALERFTGPADALLAWLGPHICRQHYEVGAEVIQACAALGIADTAPASRCGHISSHHPDHARLDLGGLVRALLERAGVTAIYGANRCTFAHERLCYSHRRATSAGMTGAGRMASLIWIEPSKQSP